MRFFLAVFLATAALAQQHPNLSGIWQMNPEKSKLPAGGPRRMLIKIDHRDPKMDGIALVQSAAGSEVRSEFHYTSSGEEAIEASRGLHIRGRWDGADVVIETTSTSPDGKEQRSQARFSLSADGKTLTMIQSNGTTTIPLVLDRAAPELAAEFSRPEKKASEAYRNVRLLGDLTQSGLIDAMNVYRHSLNVDCGYCHTSGGAFEKDDLAAKETARKMILMVRELNQKLGSGKVSCWTCHRGSVRPAVAP